MMVGSAGRVDWWSPFERRRLQPHTREMVEINKVYSPHEIWVTLKSDLAVRDEILDWLNSAAFLDSAQGVEEAKGLRPPYRAGMACVARVEEWGVWGRAETVMVRGGWGVRLVDYGDVVEVPARNLRLVPRRQELMKTPALAVKTTLENVEWKDKEGKWTEPVVTHLRRYLSCVKEMRVLQGGLREEGDDEAWLKYYVDFTIAGGGKSGGKSTGKSLTTAFIHEGHAVYTTHPERRIVEGGLLKSCAQWEFGPLRPVVLTPDELTGRIRVVIHTVDARLGKIAVSIDDPETAVRKSKIDQLIFDYYRREHGHRHPDLRPQALGMVQIQERGREVKFYRAQCMRIEPNGLLNVYLVDEAVNVRGLLPDYFLELPNELLREAPLAVPTVLHAFNNPVTRVTQDDGTPGPVVPSKMQRLLEELLKFYAEKSGVASMKLFEVTRDEIQIVLYLNGFTHSLNDILLGFTNNERDKRWHQFLSEGGNLQEALRSNADGDPHPYVESFFKAAAYRKSLAAHNPDQPLQPQAAFLPGCGRGLPHPSGPLPPTLPGDDVWKAQPPRVIYPAGDGTQRPRLRVRNRDLANSWSAEPIQPVSLANRGRMAAGGRADSHGGMDGLPPAVIKHNYYDYRRRRHEQPLPPANPNHDNQPPTTTSWSQDALL